MVFMTKCSLQMIYIKVMNSQIVKLTIKIPSRAQAAGAKPASRRTRRSCPTVSISLESITWNGHVSQFPPLRMLGRCMSSSISSAAWGHLQSMDH